MTSTYTNILREAERIVEGPRRDEYGDMRECFEMIANLWSDYVGTEISVFDVAHMMILLKVARGRDGFKRDSLVDICGYAYCAELLESVGCD